MSLKLQKEVCFKLRQVRLITQAPKYGKTSHMTQKVTYGRWDVYSTKCVLLILHSEQMIWVVSLRRLLKEFILPYQDYTQVISLLWSRLSYNRTQVVDQVVNRFWIYVYVFIFSNSVPLSQSCPEAVQIFFSLWIDPFEFFHAANTLHLRWNRLERWK